MGDEGVVSVPDQQVGIVWPHGRSDNLVISVDLEGRLNYFAQGNPKPVRIIEGHQKSITAAGLIPSASSKDSLATFYTGSYDGRVRAWNLSTGSASAIDGESHSNQVSSISAGTGRMYSVAWDDTLRTIDVPSSTFTGSATKTSGQPAGVAHSSSGSVLVATHKGIDIFSASSGEKTGTLDTKFSATCIAVPHFGTTIAVGGDDRVLRIYSLSGSSLKEESQIPALAAAPSTLSFSPTGSLLAVGLASGGISVYNTSDWSLVTSRWSAHTARVTAISWRKDGEFAVSGSLDTNVFVWSLKSPGKRVKAAGAHKDGVGGVVWVEGEGEAGKERVISVGADAAVKVWGVSGLV